MLDVFFIVLSMKCFVICHLCMYIDDILVSSWTIEEHEDHLREVFTRLCANNVTVNMEKCMLAQPP